MKRTLILYAFCLLTSACTKKAEVKLIDQDKPKFDRVSCTGNCYVLTGQLHDTPYMNKLANVELRLYYNSFRSSLRDFIGVCRTDANGLYQFRFDASDYPDPKAGVFHIEHRSAHLMYFPNDYMLSSSSIHLDSSYFNRPYIRDFTLVHKASFKVRIRSHMQVNFEYLEVQYLYCMAGFGKFFQGPGPLETSYIVQTAAGLPTTIEWKTDKGQEGKGSITVQPGTEPVYEIEF